MKFLILIGIVFSLASCSNSDTYNRGYVISKSHLEPDMEVSEDPAEVP